MFFFHTNFCRQHFVPAAAPPQQPAAPTALQQAQAFLQQNVQQDVASTQQNTGLGALPQGQTAASTVDTQQAANIPPPPQAAPTQQPHPNLFQEAVIQHATAVVTGCGALQGPASNQPALQQSRFGAFSTLSSSDSSTTTGSSSSSGDSASSVGGANVPAGPSFKSLGPHPNVPFDV